jgi:hypothetical protein
MSNESARWPSKAVMFRNATAYADQRILPSDAKLIPKFIPQPTSSFKCHLPRGSTRQQIRTRHNNIRQTSEWLVRGGKKEK